MTFKDTYEMLVMIGPFRFTKPPSILIPMGKFETDLVNFTIYVERRRIAKELLGFGVNSMSFGRNRHTIRMDLGGKTLFVYINKSIVMYDGNWEGETKPERTFRSFKEVKEYVITH